AAPGDEQALQAAVSGTALPTELRAEPSGQLAEGHVPQELAPGSEGREGRDGFEGSEGGEGRRRRRRGGRGRGRDAAEGTDTRADAAEDDAPEASPFETGAAAPTQAVPERLTAEAVAAASPAAVEPAAGSVAAPGAATGAAPEASPEPVASPAPAEQPAAAPVASAAPSPRAAQPFVLPITALESLATNAGLQWVHSDAQKVQAAQEAIANAPQPVHVPRQPKPRMVVDEGPLVLVETRKDLSQMRMPFDQA
ncbi:MAG: ribonuclease E/G, partial [Betaproteobacteria bacterium]